MVDGTTYTATVNATGVAELFTTTGGLTDNTTFVLTSVTNDATSCALSADAGAMLDDVEVEVEEIPTASITLSGDLDDPVTAEDGMSATVEICANDELTITATNATSPIAGGTNMLDVEIDDPNGFFPGLSDGSFTAAALTAALTDVTFANLGATQLSATVSITPFISRSGVDEEDQCEGATTTVTINVNPTPVAGPLTATTCSDVALDTDLDDAITNGVTGNLFSYTVEVDGQRAPDLDRTTASTDNVTDEFNNVGDDSYDVVYTVTVVSAAGCPGNNFTFTVTVNPEPVISADQTLTVCSGDGTGLMIGTDNNVTSGASFRLVSVTPSSTDDTFVSGGGVDDPNAAVDATGGADFLAGDEFTNTGSEPVTVTYVIEPTAGSSTRTDDSDDCTGDQVSVVVTVLPQPVVAPDLVFEVCSGTAVDIDIDDLTTNGVGEIVGFTRTIMALTTLRIFDENGSDRTLQASVFDFDNQNSGSTSTNPAVQDSFVNQGTAMLRVRYNIMIEVPNGDGSCNEQEVVAEVQVREEVDVVLETTDDGDAICTGGSLTLRARYDGRGAAASFTYDFVSADGVMLDLAPSVAGTEVEVSAAAGSAAGLATVLVTVVDDSGCSATASIPVSVGEAPAEQEIDGPDVACGGGVSNFYSVEDNGGSFEWSFTDGVNRFVGNGNTGPSVEIAFSEAVGSGPYTLEVTETVNGCSTTSSLDISITDETFADFTFTVDGRTVSFTEVSGGEINYFWTFGDGPDDGTTDDDSFSTDPNPTFTFPGTEETFEVTLVVDGLCAATGNSATVTQTVNLNPAFVDDVIQLERGTNFISFDVEFDNRNASAVFANVQGLINVSTMEDNIPQSYDPSQSPRRNTLKTVKDDYGYIVVVDRAQTMTVRGLPVDPNFQRATEAGINFVGHCAQADVRSDDRLDAMETTGVLVAARTFGSNVSGNAQFYTPGGRWVRQTLRFFKNSIGYALITSGDDGGVPASSRATESYDFISGNIGGTAYLPGTEVEILNAAGERVGTLVGNENGEFSAVPLFGKVDRPDGTIGAFELDESVSFRYNGQVLRDVVRFHGDYTGQTIELNFDADVVVPESGITATVFPNPAVDQITVTLTSASRLTTVDVQVLDANGRLITQLLQGEELPVGTTRVTWNEMAQLPAGLYHVVVSSQGQLLPELTQRVIKR